MVVLASIRKGIAMKTFGYAETQIVEAILSYMDANPPAERTLAGFTSFMRGYAGAAGLFDVANAFKALHDATPD